MAERRAIQKRRGEARHVALRAAADPLFEVKFSDIHTFLSVQRNASVTGAARELSVSPSQVSKAIARLEKILRVTLFARSSRGVAVNSGSLWMVEHFEAVITAARRLRRLDETEGPSVALAGSSYLIAAFLPEVVALYPQFKVRGVQLPDTAIRARAAENTFNLALASGAHGFPATWTCERIGEVRRSAFASPKLAAKLKPYPVPVSKIRSIPFIVPVYGDKGQIMPQQDGCPLDFDERKLGHEVQTIGLGLDLAMTSEQLVFGPRIAARHHLSAGTLTEIPVQGWDVREPLDLVCNSDRVSASVFRAVVTAFRSAIEKFGG